jgi:hypothetical protein
MDTRTLIVHGWSDCSVSFVGMRDMLIKRGVGRPEDILFVDYESRADELTMDEIARGLHNRLKQRKVIGESGEEISPLNVIAHSTGGLVIRHWIDMFYREGLPCPVKRLVMLAPANFGSPLAHRGKSYLGSLVKGRWKVGDFLEVGRRLLDDLELGSPFQWDLAHRDLLVTSRIADRVESTVLVGNGDYQGLRGWVNKPGTDGTIVVSGAGINIAKVVVDYTRSAQGDVLKRPTLFEHSSAAGNSAIGVLKGLNHGTIVEAAEHDGSLVSDLMVKALTTTSRQSFQDLRTELARGLKDAFDLETRPYQQFVFRAVDDYGEPVRDYNMEFFFIRRSRWEIDAGFVAKTLAPWRDEHEEEFSRRVNDLLTANAHTNTTDTSYRRTLVDAIAMNQLYREVEQRWQQDYVLGAQLHIPESGDAYRYDTGELQNVVLYDPSEVGRRVEQLFAMNVTTLVELRVRRYSGYVYVGTQPRHH